MRLIRDLLKNNCTISAMERKKRKAIGNQWFAWNHLASRLIFASSLLIFMLLFSSLVYAQNINPKRAQWIKSGGTMVFSGKHHYKKSDPVDGARKGIITVRGPGLIGLATRDIHNTGPGMWTTKAKDGSHQGTQWLGGLAKLKGNNGWVWEGEYRDFIPSSNAGGWIPPPTKDNPTTALDVRAVIEGGPRALVRNDISIEFEYWYFPFEGGGLVSVIEYGPNGKKIDVTAGKPLNLPLDKPGITAGKRDGTVLYPIADSHVYAYSYLGWNKANWGKYKNIGAGYNPTGGEKRAFLKFNLTGINPNSVNKATLRLYQHHTGGGNAVDLGVYRVMSPWIEGRGTYKPASAALPGELTWVNQPKIDRYPVVYFNPGQRVNKWVDVDVTSLIKAWLTGIPNHGLAIKGGDNLAGKPESQYGFYSREYKENHKRPQLLLNGQISDAKPDFSNALGKNLLLNPGFEQGTAGLTATSGIQHWEVVRENVDVVGTYWQQINGKKSIDLAGIPGSGAIQQTFSTIPGRRYEVNFFIAGNPACDNPYKQMRYSAAGQYKDISTNTKGKSLQNMGWKKITWSFTANSSRTTLKFESVGPNRYCGMALDNVSVFLR